jgi:two-component system chemotaxis response regulator CheB
VNPTPQTTDRPLRIVLVEESEATRRMLVQVLTSSPEFEVVGSASNGEDAFTEVFRLLPDVVCVGLQMPRMDGFTFLRLLMSRHPMPVIAIAATSASSKTEVFKALELGAIDCVLKPEGGEAALAGIRDDLFEKLRVVRSLRVADPEVRGAEEVSPPGTPLAASTGVSSAIAPAPAQAAVPSPSVVATPGPLGSPVTSGASLAGPAPASASVSSSSAFEPLRLVVLGASTGGPPALQQLLSALPRDLPLAIAVAQHMPERYTGPFAERLGRMSQFEVSEAKGGERIMAGKVLVAPGGKHLKLERTGAGGIELRAVVVEPTPGTIGKRYCPSVDLLFESAARAMGDRVCAIVLTGMGTDGRKGIEAVKAAGGLTLAESESSAVVFGMPREAADSGSVDEVLPLDKMAERIVRFARNIRTPSK